MKEGIDVVFPLVSCEFWRLRALCWLLWHTVIPSFFCVEIKAWGREVAHVCPKCLVIYLGCSQDVHPGRKHCWVHWDNLNDHSVAALWPQVCSWAPVTCGGSRLWGKPSSSPTKAAVAVCGSVWPFLTAEGCSAAGGSGVEHRCWLLYWSPDQGGREVVQDVERHLQLWVAAGLGCPLDSL